MSLGTGKGVLLVSNEDIKELAFTGWNKRKAGFYSPGDQSDESSSSDGNALEILWSSSPSDCADAVSTRRTFPHISRQQRNRVITRLNFDDCVVQKHRTPRQKRAKIKRFVTSCSSQNVTSITDVQPKPELQNNIVNVREKTDVFNEDLNVSIYSSKYYNDVKHNKEKLNIEENNVKCAKTLPNPQLIGNNTDVEIKDVELDKNEIFRDCNVNAKQGHAKDTITLSNSQCRSNLALKRVSVINDTNDARSGCFKICLSSEPDGTSSVVVKENEMTVSADGKCRKTLKEQDIPTSSSPPPQSCGMEITSPVIGSCRSKPTCSRKKMSTYKARRAKYVSNSVSTISCMPYAVIQNSQRNVIGVINPVINSSSVPTSKFHFSTISLGEDSHSQNLVDTVIVKTDSNTQPPVLNCVRNSQLTCGDSTNRQSPILSHRNKYKISNRDALHCVVNSEEKNEKTFCHDFVSSPILSSVRKPKKKHSSILSPDSNAQSSVDFKRHSKVKDDTSLCHDSNPQSQILGDVTNSIVNNDASKNYDFNLQSQVLGTVTNSKLNHWKVCHDHIPQSPVLGCVSNSKVRKPQKKKRRTKKTAEVENEDTRLQSSVLCSNREHWYSSVGRDGEEVSTLTSRKKLNVCSEETVIQEIMPVVTQSVTSVVPNNILEGDISDRNVELQNSCCERSDTRNEMYVEHCSSFSLNQSELLANSIINEHTFPLSQVYPTSQLKTELSGKWSTSIALPNAQKSDVLNISFESQKIDVVIDKPGMSRMTQVVINSASDIGEIIFDSENQTQISHELIIESMNKESRNILSDNENTGTCRNRDSDTIDAMKRETVPHDLVTESSSSLFIESISSQEPTYTHHIDKQLTQENHSSCTRAISQTVSPVEPSEGIISSGSSTKGSQDKTGPELSPQQCHKTLPNMDSAKKRRKRVKKNGLADRLRKLLTRQRSAARMWQHEVSSANRSTRKGTLLVVSKVWMEYTHTLVLCSPSLNKSAVEKIPADQKPENCGPADSTKELNSAWIVVLDVETVPPRHLKHKSTIKIYPPWQTLRVSRLNVSLILSVTHVEVLSAGMWMKDVMQPPKVSSLKEFSCPCLQDESVQKSCKLELPRCGLDLLELLFPLQSSARSSNATNCQLLNVVGEAVEQRGTVVEAVLNHSHALIGNIWLMLRIHRVFCYRQCGPGWPSDEEVPRVKLSMHNFTWSVLGEDVAGEICEVILGSQPTVEDESVEWGRLLNGTAQGSMYRFTGLTVVKRISRHKAPGLWTIVEAFEDAALGGQELLKSSAQLFLYVLSTAGDTCEMTYISSPPEKYPILPRVDTLATVLKQAMLESCSRHTVIAKVLALNNSNLYLTDTSLSCSEPHADNPLYAIVTINSSCVVPTELSSRRGSVVYLQDLQIYKGQLYADKYSCLIVAKESNSTFAATVDTDYITTVDHLQPLIAHLRSSSVVNELVTITGSVIVVDEETAFAWPACAQCSNELLCELEDGFFFCQICSENAQVSTMMSLEVFVSCPALPKHCRVKVKLQQDSIASLLPPTQNNGQGYEMASVLNKIMGPLLCVVLKVKTTSCKDSKDIITFILEEIPSWEEHVQAQLQEIVKIMELDSVKVSV